MHPVAFSVGGVDVYAYPIMMLLAFVAGGFTLAWALEVRGVVGRHAGALTLAGAFGGLVGARVAYALGHTRDFTADPLTVLKLSEGGLVFYGGLVGGGLAVWALARVRGLRVPRVADAGAVALALGAAIGRLGCFLNGCCAGVPSGVRWAITLPGEDATHPTQLYDAGLQVALLSVGALALRFARLPEGIVWWSYLLTYALGRFAIESLRRTPEFALGLSGAQLASVLVVPIAAVALARSLRVRAPRSAGA